MYIYICTYISISSPSSDYQHLLHSVIWYGWLNQQPVLDTLAVSELNDVEQQHPKQKEW